MKKVLLINPPGDQDYIRDYFCSKISKSGYLYHPTDLLVASGTLSEHFELMVIDAIVERLGVEDCLQRIRSFAPDFVLFLSGSVSAKQDAAFLMRMRREVPSIEKVAGIGDVYFGNPEKKLRENDALDAVLIDFTSDDIARYFLGEPCENLPHKENGEIVCTWKAPKKEHFSIPIPRYDLFPNHKYYYPFTREKPFAVVLTNFGCPFKCRFCIMPQLGFKVREVENILEELRYLDAHGFRNIYFNDQTFGASRSQTKRLLTAMADEGLTMGWVCFSRVDIMDEELLMLMKQAGCHTIMFGVESADPALLERYSKGITPEKVRTAVELCHKHRIRTLGTFIIGLPGETRETALKTIDFATSIPLDYAAFNIAIPRMGTDLRDQAIAEHLVDEDVEEMDQSGSAALIRTEGLDLADIEALQKLAYRRFYLRPGKIVQKLLDIRTRVDLENHVRNGWGVVKNIFSRRKGA